MAGSEAVLGIRDALHLADWRRQVAEVYAQVRSAPTPADGWEHWRRERDRLFLQHEQSPLPAHMRTADRLPRYFPYDSSRRVLAVVEECQPEPVQLPPSSGEPVPAHRVGTARFDIGGQACSLALYWLDEYSGGLFVSFRDATSGVETYGSGRYIIDSAKGADLGTDGDRLVLDFNFSYQPSCSYADSWSCPLPPRDNWLSVAVRAGERLVEVAAFRDISPAA
jgi:uncharacterized protein (DUF1684 family)